MIIYRVYESYHESSESGTVEYGYYSLHERAKQRALDVWKQKGYGGVDEVSPSGSLYAQSGWGYSAHIRVIEIEVDQDSNQDVSGYT